MSCYNDFQSACTLPIVSFISLGGILCENSEVETNCRAYPPHDNSINLKANHFGYHSYISNHYYVSILSSKKDG